MNFRNKYLNNKTTYRYSFEITQEVEDLITNRQQVIAKHTGEHVSKSQLIREAIKAYLK